MSEIKAGVWMRLTETCKPDEGEWALLFCDGDGWVAIKRGEDGAFRNPHGYQFEIESFTYWLRIPPAPKGEAE